MLKRKFDHSQSRQFISDMKCIIKTWQDNLGNVLDAPESPYTKTKLALIASLKPSIVFKHLIRVTEELEKGDIDLVQYDVSIYIHLVPGNSVYFEANKKKL